MRLGITGYAINLDNGDVEVLACGTPSALAELRTWLQSGPPMASVARLEESTAPSQDLDDFRIG